MGRHYATDADGKPGLGLFDAERKAALNLYVSVDVQERPGINMRDEQGRRRAVVGVEQDGHAFANFIDESDQVTGRVP
jgi:hypothetical protein